MSKPSSFYREDIWRLGLFLGRHAPAFVFERMTKCVAAAYWMLFRRRREVVEANLLPLLGNDRRAARVQARALFQQFAVKLADLWRFESGIPIDHLFYGLIGWEHFEAARSRRRGVLLLTVHLGNWEFGAPLLTERGVRLQVITMAEPQQRLTELRQSARRRWGVETVALGDSPFASVEIIRRLEADHCVALLMDRPPRPTGVPVSLFGKNFLASVSAAELARATGCALLPVILPRTDRGYVAHILPEIPYERGDLGNRPARIALTQRIMQAFEPAIRQHSNQWYHFVPIWPKP